MHIPVLRAEIISYLDPQLNECYIDATFGRGGHSYALLNYLEQVGTILALDWDPLSYQQMRQELMAKKLTKKIILRNENFKHIKKVAQREGFTSVKGIVFDLGISNWHYQASGRGFSFQKDEPLDMRINPQETKVTAFEIVNYASEKELTDIFQKYGQERAARRVAETIVRRRKVKKIESSSELAEVVIEAKRKPRPGQKRPTTSEPTGKIHPATQIFMALRSVINGELENLSQGLADSYDLLQPGGRIVVLSFQGLEDVVIKDVFRQLKKAGAKTLTSHVVRPTFDEIKSNPSARSAKLRALMKPASIQ